MKKLNLKLARDIKSSKWLFIAVSIVIFLAVTFFGVMFMAGENLGRSYDYAYKQLNFADLTVKLSGDLQDVEEELKSIEGVKSVTGRMNAEYSLTLPGEQTKNVLVRALSLPSSRADIVNDVHIESGSYFTQNDGNSLLLEKNFAEHHGLEPGDTLLLSVHGKSIPFEIAGVATSPEYIFFAKSRQELLVSPEIWGVVFVPDLIRESLLNQPINEYCFLLKEGYDNEAVLADIKNVLGDQILDIVWKEDQPSYAGLEMDLEQFETMANMFPLLFIIVGAMAIYILLTRIVYNQRTQIGLMRAVGYSRRQIMGHYLGFSVIVGSIGSVAGIITAYFLSEALTKFYATMINLPFTTTESHWMAIGEGVSLGLLPCLIAGLIPAWHASRILPAEAMRAPAPATGRRMLLERIFPFLNKLSSTWKIPLRNIFRNGRRSLYTVIGIVFGICLILVSAGMIDSSKDLFDFQFNKIQRYDARIDFAEPRPASLIEEFYIYEGVEKVEPMLQMPAKLDYGGKTYTTMLIALPADSDLRGLYSPSRKAVSLPNQGMMLTEALSDTLDVDIGDMLSITVQLPTGTFNTQLEIKGFINDPLGSFGYIDIELAQSVAGEAILNGMLLEITPGYENEIRKHAYDAGAASVELTSETHERVDSMMKSGIAMLWIMLLFGATLAMAIVFTTVMVNIMERRREIATMRTLGESKGRITTMITIENLLLGLIGLIPGMVLGYMLAWYFFSLFQGDMFSMDLVIFPTTYALTAGIVIIIVLLSQIPGIRNANQLNIAQVTKEQAS